MNRYAICVLANNMYFLERFLANYHKPPSISLILVNEDRIGDKTQEIEKLCGKYKVEATIVKATKVIKAFAKHVTDTKFLHEYTMGMNILMQWYVFRKWKEVTKLLSLDDDTLVNPGIVELFEELDCVAFKRFRLSAGPVWEKANENVKSYLEQWCKLYDREFNKLWYDGYIGSYKNSGQIFFTMEGFELPNYEASLKRFFESEYMAEKWKGRRTHTSYFFDEIFMCMQFPGYNDKLKGKAMIITANLDRHPEVIEANYRNMSKYPIVHFVVRSMKQKTYEYGIVNKFIR